MNYNKLFAGLLACVCALSVNAQTVAYVVPSGTVGNQDLSHVPQSLGMDFDVNSAISITSLGVFDSGGDGLVGPLRAHIYNRDTQTALATVDFTTNQPGTLVGGSRFRSLDTALVLPQGFQGTVVVDYLTTPTEPNGNWAHGSGSWTTDSGGGLISFVGSARTTVSGIGYPNVIDGGPENRYAAGTFMFSAARAIPQRSYDLARDFSIASNPNGVWSYGWKSNLAGAFTAFTLSKTNIGDNGVPAWVWAKSSFESPAVLHNFATNTVTSGGGQGNYPPGTTWFAPGPSGFPEHFSIIRFTAPPGGAGTYRIETAVSPEWNGSIQGDSDFHVLLNGMELFGRALPAGASTAYSSNIVLHAGDSVDFAVGRGADGSYHGSGLKIQATLDLISINPPPPPPDTLSFIIPRTVVSNNTPYGSGTLVNVGHRNQQIYGSAELPPYPVLIHEIRFRPDSTFGGPFSAIVSNVQINFSTTRRNLDALSPVYAENVGPDDTVVFQGLLSISSQFTGPADGPKDFDVVVQLARPYLYDPAKGNLVIDTRNFSGSTANPVLLGGQSGPDEAGRVLGDLAAASGVVDTGADAIQVWYTRASTNPPPPPPPGADYDLSRDFSLAGNPNGVWSYGRQDILGGAFTLLGIAKTNIAGNGVPVQVWAISPFSQPAILHNATTETATTDGGQGNYPPGTTWFVTGARGDPGNFAVIRFRAPTGGTYALATTVRPSHDGSIHQDTDFHVLRNGVELFGRQLPAGGSASYNNNVSLAAGDTIDFALGRGADDSHIGSGLKVEATLDLVSTNPPPPSTAPCLVVPSGLDARNGSGGTGTLDVPHRLQVVYAASMFPGQPISIREIRFRPNVSLGHAFSTTVSNIQFTLSTTHKSPDALSATFSENSGSDAAVVFSGSLNISSGFSGPASGPKEFDVIIRLTRPFVYNPASGNLLLDMKNFSGSLASKLDGEGAIGDGVSRVISLDVDGASGNRDSAGDVLQICYDPANSPCLVVPPGLDARNGSGGTGTLDVPHRLQVVYAASMFPGQPISIREIRFRPNVSLGHAFSTTVSNIQFTLSTTHKTPDALSATFSENSGPDAAVVFSGSLNISSGFSGPASGPKEFDVVIPFARPFVYNPALGNLLLDMKNFSGSLASKLDGEGAIGDGVSRVISLDVDGASGNRDSAADVLQICYDPTNSPPVAVDHDLSRDFSLSGNPNGPWSYGYLTSLDGTFGRLNAPRIFGADNGVPIAVWELNTFQLPTVGKVLGPSIAISDGGRFTAPAGTMYFAPGADGAPHNFGAVRFTVPADAAGEYRLETSVRSLFDGTRSRDADFHVLKNGVELFGQFLPPNSGTSYSNVLTLAAGDRIDFAIGRGADGLTADTALKITARLTLLSTTVPGNLPPTVRITSPRDGSSFSPGSDIRIDALTRDSDGYAPMVEFFANGRKIGEQTKYFIQAPTNGAPVEFSFVWSNVVGGTYGLTAKATDNEGASSFSDPVRIVVGEGEPPPPTNDVVVTITASDGFASEGPFTNCYAYRTISHDQLNTVVWGTNCVVDANIAAFVIHRRGPTNEPLTVWLRIGGTASNGVDYASITPQVAIPAGVSRTQVVIRPVDDAMAEEVETVVLQLVSGTGETPYRIGWPDAAAAVISDARGGYELASQRLPDGCFHLRLPGRNGERVRIEASHDLTNWVPVDATTVTDGAVHFVDPDAHALPRRFYRAVPDTDPVQE